jgi:NAD(P)-dependent dehydrogenase (short-subunit alcohol dehydrogenase family)
MNSAIKTVLITGSNKGIGYGILRGLLQKEKEYNLILSARSEDLGKKSLLELKKEFESKSSKIFFHQLDITKEDSIAACLSWIKTEFGQIDILVNNAAVATKGPEFNLDVFNFTYPSNVYGTISLTEQMLKANMIREGGKIIIIGSSLGKLNALSENMKKEFLDEEITVEKLLVLAERFKQAIIDNKVKENGWTESAYATSKMIINTYARALARRTEIKERQIGAFSCCPGWVRTDMAGPKALLSIEEGVLTPIYLIELPEGINEEYQGKFFYLCKVTPLSN